MKKILIATDLHGSVFYAQKILDKFFEEQADLLVLLGDIYYHGPRNPLTQNYNPLQLAEMLNSVANKLLVIKGNCDSEVDQFVSKFQFLQHNIMFFGGKRLFFTHGHIYNNVNLPPLAAGDILFYGHFHQNQISEVDGVLAVNVGSASLPKDGIHGYAVLTEEQVVLKDLTGGAVIAMRRLADKQGE